MPKVKRGTKVDENEDRERMGSCSKKTARKVQVIVPGGKGGEAVHGNGNASCSDAEMAEEGASDFDSEDDVPLDGHQEDAVLARADALTMEEVVRRRARRTKQLIRLYKQQYWGLMEELRAKYRRFYLRHGKSGWREEGDEPATAGEPAEAAPAPGPEEGNMKMPHAPERPSPDSLKCGVQGCSTKPLPLSGFCFAHILLEPRQRLYLPCTFIIRSGTGGSVTCGRPTLRAMVPLLCTMHFQEAQKQAARTLRKANLSTSSSKAASKLHLTVAEYVRAIQVKRRALRVASKAPEKKAGKVASGSLKEGSSLSTLSRDAIGN